MKKFWESLTFTDKAMIVAVMIAVSSLLYLTYNFITWLLR